MAGAAVWQDADFIREALSLLGFADAASLLESLLERGDPDGIAFTARLVTAWAARGAPLARAICDEAAGELAHGVRLLAPFFSGLSRDAHIEWLPKP